MATRKTGDSTAKPGAEAKAPEAVDTVVETKPGQPTKPAAPEEVPTEGPDKFGLLVPPTPGHRAPTVLSAQRDADGNITVRWNDDSYQVTITRYLVQVWKGSRFSNGAGGYVTLEETPILERVAQPGASSLTFPPGAGFYSPDSRYTVTVLSYSSANPSGLSANFVVLAGYQETPAISAVACDGGAVTVSWSDPTAETKPDFYLLTFQGPGGTETWRTPSSLPTLRFSFVPAQTIDLPGKALGQPTYTVQVAGQYAGSATAGPASPAVGVLFKTITPVIVANNGTDLKIQWQDPLEPGVASVRVAVWEADRLVSSQTATVSALVVVLSRQAGVSSQSVTLQLLGTATAGPVGPQVGVIGGAPALRSVEGGAGDLRIGWTQVLEPAVTGYEISIPGVTGTFSTPDTELRLPLDLGGLGSGQLNLSARGPLSIGPATSFGALTAAPVLTGVGINAAGELTATWTPPAGSPAVAGPLGFELAVWSGGVKLASQLLAQSATTGSVPGALTAGRAYTARLRMVSQAASPVARGPWSAEVPILVEIPTLLSAVYDGQLLALAWTAVSEPGVEAYDVAVLGSGDRLVAGARSSETRLDLPLELTGALAGPVGDEDTFDAQVTPRGSFSAGRPAARLRVFRRAPRITAVRYDAAAGRITVDWTLPQRRRAEVVELAVFEGEAIAARSLVDFGNQGNLAVQLDAARGFALRARIVETVGSAATAGPWSPAAAIVAFQPAVTHARYDGQTLELAWTPANDPGITTYRVVVDGSGLAPIEERVTGTAAALWLDPAALGVPSFPFSGQPPRYNVKVAALAGFAQGPDSPAVTVMALAPTITAVRRENDRLRVDWRFDAAPDADRTELALFDGGAFSRTATDVSGITGSIDGPFDDGRDLTVRARTVKGVVWGPWSTPVAVLGGPPQITRTAFDGDELAVDWTPVAGRGVEAYRVRLYADGFLAQETRVAGTTYRTRYGAILAALPGAPARPSLAVEVAAVGLATEGVASSRLTLLTLAPEITGAAWSADGGTVVATWNVPSLNFSGFSGQPLYELALFDGGSFVRSSTQGNSPAQGMLAGPFGEGRDLALRARVLLAPGMGAWSPAVALPTSRPAILAAVVDGEALRLAWSAATEPAVQAYRVEILAQGAPAWTGRVAGTALALPRAAFLAADPLPGTLYAARVTAVAPLALGPVGAPATLLLAAPEITQVTTAAAVAVFWRIGGQLPSGTVAELALSDGGSRLSGTVINGAQSAGVLPLPADAGRDYGVAVRLVLGPAAGPWSARVPALVGQPAIDQADYDGTLLDLRWSAVTEPGVLAYEVTLAGPSPIATFRTTGTALSRLLTLPLNANLTATVKAVGPRSDGRPGAAVAVVAGAPEITAVRYVAAGPARVEADWPAAPPPPGAGFELALFDGGALLLSATGTNPAGGSLAASLVAGRAYTVRCRLTAGASRGPWSGAAPVIVGAPAVRRVAYDGGRLTVDWEPVAEPGALAYRVAIRGAAGDLAAGTFPGGTAAFEVALPAGAGTASVTAVGAAVTGPPAAAGFTVPARAALQTVTWQDGQLIAHWAPQAGVTGFRLDLAVGMVRVTSFEIADGAAAFAAVDAPLSPGAPAALTLTALAGAVAGPPSAALAVVTRTPELTEVRYDGQTLAAAWTAVAPPDPRWLTTYRLTVSQTGATVAAILATVDTDAPQASLPIALAGDGVTVAVQAQAGPSQGPSSAPVDPLAGPAALFFSRDGAAAPYVFRSARRPGQPGGGAVALSFPDLFAGAAPASPPAGAFTLAANGGGYTVTAAPSVWTFDGNAVRAAQWNDLLAFLRWLEPAARPGAVPYVRRALALGLPLTFAETLLYRYGLSPADGYVDLLPGMRLRLDSEAYQLIPGGDPADLNGFVSTGSATYELTAGPIAGNVQPLAFDAFLSRLASTAVDAGSGGAGGILDLYGAGGNRPYCRLFYPAHLPPASSQGYSDPSRNVALVGASRLADLDAVTASYLAERNFQLAAGLGATVTYFRGRLAALPRIVVHLDGEAVEVAVGTTLGQLLADVAHLPLGGAPPVRALALERPLPGVVDAGGPPPAGPLEVSAAQSARVSFRGVPAAAYATGETWSDLPLLGGDRLTVFGDRS